MLGIIILKKISIDSIKKIRWKEIILNKKEWLNKKKDNYLNKNKDKDKDKDKKIY